MTQLSEPLIFGLNNKNMFAIHFPHFQRQMGGVECRRRKFEIVILKKKSLACMVLKLTVYVINVISFFLSQKPSEPVKFRYLEHFLFFLRYSHVYDVILTSHVMDVLILVSSCSEPTITQSSGKRTRGLHEAVTGNQGQFYVWREETHSYTIVLIKRI